MAGAATSQGTGWWQASDGLWYPPESAAVTAAPAPAQAVMTASSLLTPVSNGRRILAYLLEGVLLVVTLFIGWLVWSMILWGEGQSPAKKLMGMRCVKVDTGQPATWGTMFLREIVGKGIIGGVTFGLTSLASIFMILFGSDRRGVWDLVAGTVVVDG